MSALSRTSKGFLRYSFSIVRIVSMQKRRCRKHSLLDALPKDVAKQLIHFLVSQERPGLGSVMVMRTDGEHPEVLAEHTLKGPDSRLRSTAWL